MISFFRDRTWGLACMSDVVDFYNSIYGNFAAEALGQVRREAFGEDIGQNSWLTADECLRFLQWLEPGPDSEVLEIACGSGGPALYMTKMSGCRFTGVDINENGISAANRSASEQGLDSRAHFQTVDAGQPLPFEDGRFDCIVCIDAICHLPGRPSVLADWHRVLKPGGRMLFTDPTVITGLLSNEEISVRSSIGYFLFAPAGENEKLLRDAGFDLIWRDDVTENTVTVSKRWHDARERLRSELLKIEGELTFEGHQRFLSMVHTLSSERRLSRFAFAAKKLG